VPSAGTEAVVLTVRPDGPLVAMGEMRVLDAEGNELSQGARHFFCRCGGSQNKPFCDGTHKRNGFTG
jgi:CDGSH-type Zn-finger protein